VLNGTLYEVGIQITTTPSIANVGRVTDDTTVPPRVSRIQKVLIENRHLRKLLSSSIQSQDIGFVSTELSVLE
jgi:hypothetical protein